MIAIADNAVNCERRGADSDIDCEDYEESDPDEIDLDFSHVTANNVEIYRIYSENAKELRLEAKLYIRATKTSGNNVYAPQVYGCSYPQRDASGQEEWIPNAAVALAILSVLSGSTTLDDLISPPDAIFGSGKLVSKRLVTDVPLFKAGTSKHQLDATNPLNNVVSPLAFIARKLHLPVPLFTSRSCRRGYARRIVEGVVARSPPNSTISGTSIKETLNTSARWKSDQATRYITDIWSNVVGGSYSDVGTTAFEWDAAAFKSSPISRTYPEGSLYATMDRFEEVMVENDMVGHAFYLVG